MIQVQRKSSAVLAIDSMSMQIDDTRSGLARRARPMSSENDTIHCLHEREGLSWLELRSKLVRVPSSYSRDRIAIVGAVVEVEGA